MVCRAHVCDTDLRGSLAFCLASLLLTGTSFLWSHLPSSHPCSQAPFASDVTGTIPEQQLLSCGARDCLMATAPANSTNRPSQELIYTLLGIYTGKRHVGSPGSASWTPSWVGKTVSQVNTSVMLKPCPGRLARLRPLPPKPSMAASAVPCPLRAWEPLTSAPVAVCLVKF